MFLFNEKKMIYNVVKQNRYHWNTLMTKKYVTNNFIKTKLQRYLRERDLRKKNSLMCQLIFVLNLIRSKIYDALYSKWQKFERILYKLFFSQYWQKQIVWFFLKIIQRYRYFFDWFWIQNSIYYIASWSFSEIEKTMIFLSFVLRNHVNVNWFWFRFFETIKTYLIDDDEHFFYDIDHQNFWFFNLLQYFCE